MSEWIKCSERMPDPETDVLVFFGGRSLYVRRWIPDDGVHAYGWYPGGSRGATHWMPLPEPPQES